MQYFIHLTTENLSKNPRHCREAGPARDKTNKEVAVRRTEPAVQWFSACQLLLKYLCSMQLEERECWHRDVKCMPTRQQVLMVKQLPQQRGGKQECNMLDGKS